MARWDNPIHGMLTDRLALEPGQLLVDLGCGTGGTLHAAALAAPGIRGIGLDSDVQAISKARDLLAGVDCQFERTDLTRQIDLPAESVDRIVCHNVLECLADPSVLVAEATRLLAPGGRSVWSHVDFDGILLTATDEQRNREVLTAYAELAQPWMDHADGRMGRKLPGLIRQSSLRLESVEVLTSVSVELAGDARARVDEIADSLSGSTDHEVTPRKIKAWREELDRLASTGQFFFAEPTIVVTAGRS